MASTMIRATFRAASALLEKEISTPATSTSAVASLVHTRLLTKVTRTGVRCYANGRPETGYVTESDSESDSDSEGPHRTEKGRSEFWRRKMRTFHGVIDVNKDGVVSYDDFQILAERFVNLGHLTEKQQYEFQDVLKEVWEKQWGALDRYNLVKTEEYLENMHHVLNDKSLKKKAHHFLPYLFKAVDKDKDGVISVEEFKLFFECLGLDHQDAIHSFRTIDMNSDGFLSLKEFVKLGREFFLTEDERKPSKVFWGPLVKP
ncbi:sarcoplasmic calcium-binding protein [Periplaneta americana]|uniref:sarcoplasmic calcium-binding protein n=1 Tax=Periplaneta americana TaxID=6978 RepID=UPI0037E7DD5D